MKILKSLLPNIKYKVIPKDKTKPSRGTLSVNKAKKLIKYNPNYNLEKGIKSYLEFLKN